MAEAIFRKLKRNNQNTHRVVFKKRSASLVGLGLSELPGPARPAVEQHGLGWGSHVQNCLSLLGALVWGVANAQETGFSSLPLKTHGRLWMSLPPIDIDLQVIWLLLFHPLPHSGTALPSYLTLLTSILTPLCWSGFKWNTYWI